MTSSGTDAQIAFPAAANDPLAGYGGTAAVPAAAAAADGERRQPSAAGGAPPLARRA